jgi:transposase
VGRAYAAVIGSVRPRPTICLHINPIDRTSLAHRKQPPQAHLKDFRGTLKDFRGTLQDDAFAGYYAIYEGGDVRETACMARAPQIPRSLRRTQNEVNTEALRRISERYAIEAAIRGEPPDEGRRVRLEQARPLVDAFEIWLRSTLNTVSQKGDTAKNINYALNQWAALALYVDDGVVEIDNNAAERALRAVALGRKNFMHFGSDSGGERGRNLHSGRYRQTVWP